MPDIARLNRNDVLLTVIDVQERLISVMSLQEKEIKGVTTLIEAAKILDIPVLVTEQYPKGLGVTAQEIQEVLPSYAPIVKMAFSCCGEPGYMDAVKESGKNQVILCGIEAHVCVLQTALDLRAAGYEVFVPENAVCSQKKEDWRAALDRMNQSGIIPTSIESAIFELLVRAGTEEFKAMLKVIK